jgi:hypothetical protein
VSDKVEDDLVFTVGEPMLLGRPQTGVLHLRFRIMPESPSGHPQNGSHIRLAMTTETVALLLAGIGNVRRFLDMEDIQAEATPVPPAKDRN